MNIIILTYFQSLLAEEVFETIPALKFTYL